MSVLFLQLYKNLCLLKPRNHCSWKSSKPLNAHHSLFLINHNTTMSEAAVTVRVRKFMRNPLLKRRQMVICMIPIPHLPDH